MTATATAAPSQPENDDPKQRMVTDAVKDALKRKPATAAESSKPAPTSSAKPQSNPQPAASRDDSVVRYLEGRIAELEDRLKQAELIITTYGQLAAQLTRFTAEIFDDPTALDAEPAERPHA